jgi:hypothetical protein
VKKPTTPPGFFRYWTMFEPSLGWKAARKKGKDIPLTKYAIIGHLAGEFWTSKEPSDFTDYFVLDLDVRQVRDVRPRYDELQRMFGNRLFPIRSWDNGGVHLYGFLTTPTEAKALGMELREILAETAVAPKTGFVEIYPGTVHHLRLPFGSGSYPLDSHTLQPIVLGVHESLRLIADFRERNRLKLDSLVADGRIRIRMRHERKERMRRLEVDIARGAFDPSFDTKPDREEKRPWYLLTAREYRQTGRYDFAEKHMVVNEPIWSYGTRNDLILRAIQELMLHKRLSSEETKQILHDWIDDQTLNHRSNDLELDPDSVHHQIDLAVNNFASKRYCGGKIPQSKLSLTDVRSIVEKTKPLCRKAQYGSEAFNMQRFMFHLVGLFEKKSFGFRNVPQTIMERLDGASRNTTAQMTQFCVSVGLLQLISPHDWQLHRCRCYSLQFEFHDGPEVDSLVEGLRAIYSRNELLRMYTRRIYTAITRINVQRTKIL